MANRADGCGQSRQNSPLVYEGELAVDRAARDELGRLDVDVFGRLVGRVGEEAAHRHQAGQVWGFLLGVALRVQLAARPAPHVSSAVEGTVSVRLCDHINKEVRQIVKKSLTVMIACKIAYIQAECSGGKSKFSTVNKHAFVTFLFQMDVISKLHFLKSLSGSESVFSGETLILACSFAVWIGTTCLKSQVKY